MEFTFNIWVPFSDNLTDDGNNKFVNSPKLKL